MRSLIVKAATLIAISALTIAAQAGPQIESVPGEYVVRLKKQTINVNSVQKISQKLGAYVKSTIPSLNVIVVKMPVVQTTDSVVKTLNQNSIVEYSEPNFIYHANKTPNDPMYGQLWGMKNIGQADSDGQVGMAGVDIDAEAAWDITTGNKNTLIAIIDTGVDYNHPDIKANAWTNAAEANGTPGVDDDGNGVIDDIHGYNAITNSGDPMDDHGHGTHCAGTIGGNGNDGVGVAGVNWEANIMGVKFLDANGSGTLEDAVKAIAYANKMGAKVMSNSWGGGGFSQTLFDVIKETNESGALFIAAAGNDYSNNDTSPAYPASYQVENIISVAAVDNKGLKAGFSNYGKKTVHLGAPGVNILSSTGGAYDSWSGTSMATPHVSGVAALVWGNETNLTAAEVKARLLTTARPLAGLRGKTITGGLLNAYNAVSNTTPAPDMNDPMNWGKEAFALASESPYAANTNQVFEVQATRADGAAVTEFALYFEKFETETGYDTLQIYDASGALVQSMSGRNDDFFSLPINGSYAKLVFKSDDSVQGAGWKISQIAIR
jgi:thermitase